MFIPKLEPSRSRAIEGCASEDHSGQPCALCWIYKNGSLIPDQPLTKGHSHRFLGDLWKECEHIFLMLTCAILLSPNVDTRCQHSVPTQHEKSLYLDSFCADPLKELDPPKYVTKPEDRTCLGKFGGLRNRNRNDRSFVSMQLVVSTW